MLSASGTGLAKEQATHSTVAGRLWWHGEDTGPEQLQEWVRVPQANGSLPAASAGIGLHAPLPVRQQENLSPLPEGGWPGTV